MNVTMRYGLKDLRQYSNIYNLPRIGEKIQVGIDQIKIKEIVWSIDFSEVLILLEDKLPDCTQSRASE